MQIKIYDKLCGKFLFFSISFILHFGFFLLSQRIHFCHPFIHIRAVQKVMRYNNKKKKERPNQNRMKILFLVDPFRWEVYWSEATTQSKITLSHNWISSIQKQVSTNSFWCNRLKVRHLWPWLDAFMKPPP